MKNAIYTGMVFHQRLTPKRHKFGYRVCYYFFDLNNHKQIPTIPFLLDFNQKNYLTTEKIREHIKSHFGDVANASVESIYILTQLSYFGFCFNPVSFYYCYGKDKNLLYVISLITNTPWGEKHIDHFDYKQNSGEHLFLKNFHVSPFMPMEIGYSWKFNDPQDSVHILMKNRHLSEENTFFWAQMDLKFQELNLKNVIKNFILYPFMSFKTVFGIYWQAFILFSKRVPFFTHPKKGEAL